MNTSAKFIAKIKEKRWNIKYEEELLALWDKENVYEFKYEKGKPIFSIDTPPPYASGSWHVGAAAHYAQIDMVARYFRMRGYAVYFPFGVDRNGLPVEVQVEKQIGKKAYEVPREEFIKLCSDFLDRVEKEIVYIVYRLGLSADLKNYYKTDSPEYRALTQATFIELWKRGLIYESEQPVIWCPGCKTTLAESEVEYIEKETYLNYIKFKVKETGKDIIVATTRPELLCTCAAIIFNPKDERYRSLEGKHAIVPIYKHEVPILAHPYANPEFGTGLVMLCSFGDQADVRLFRELKLKAKMAINPDGTLNEIAGPYKGLRVSEAREKIVEDLERQGYLVKRELIRHRVPVCWRSKDPIEFVPMKEFFLKQLEFKEELKKIIDKITFYPPKAKKMLLNWIDSLSIDWPISRRRVYGTEIPIWYCKKCGTPHLPEPGKYYRPWKDKPPFSKCHKCGSTEFVGETRVFDTWMDSSISPLFILKYMRDDNFFKEAFPCTLRPQGYDIIRTWLYYTLLRVYQLTGRPAFKYVRISGMGLDEKGEAMHKSKGNIVPPIPIIEKYGADALRFWAASEAKLGEDYRFSEAKIKSANLFLTKLWNIARFISRFPRVNDNEDFKLLPLDLMVLGVLNDLIKEYHDSFSKLDPFIPANSIRYFTWNFFASHYIEAVKPRAYNTLGIYSEAEQKGAWFTLYKVLEIILKLLAPITPFITDAIWRRLFSQESIHKQRLPEFNPDWDTEYKRLKDDFMNFNTAIWRYKKENGLALSSELNVTIFASPNLRPFEKDLKAMHKIRELRFTHPPSNAIEIGHNVYILERQ